jgi:predicted nucleic acid-binding protein
MKFVLDTNACIRLLKGSSVSMLKKIEHISTNDIVIPAIVRFELY